MKVIRREIDVAIRGRAIEAAGTPAERIEQARNDLDVALADLETAARRLATTEHWKNAAARSIRKRPVTVLAVALLAGMWLGRRKR